MDKKGQEFTNTFYSGAPLKLPGVANLPSAFSLYVWLRARNISHGPVTHQHGARERDTV